MSDDSKEMQTSVRPILQNWLDLNTVNETTRAGKITSDFPTGSSPAGVIISI